ncbi:MAG: response regulator, partial [Pseudomonadota bacterium]
MSDKPKILIVDDEPRICESLKALLSQFGYEIQTVSSGQKAISLLDEHHYDLVLLDIVMPDIDGPTVMTHIRQRKLDTIVIAITGRVSIESAVSVLRHGAYDYITKPFKHEDLFRTVENALDQVRLKRERLQAEEALRASEERYRRIITSLSDYTFTVYVKDGRPIKTIHSPACVGITGYTQEEYESDPELWINMVMEEDRDIVWSQARRVLLGKDSSPIEHRIVRKNGVVRWVRNTIVPCYNERGVLVSYDGLISDINELKLAEQAAQSLEAQLQQVQKLEALGTLAGGLAHDFNNLLMAIQGNVSMVLKDIPEKHPHQVYLKKIEKQVKSGASLTRQLLGYARQGKYEIKPLNLNILIHETAEAFARTRKEITLNSQLHHEAIIIEADEIQIEQVLLNLLVNASDAMPGGGTLT